MIFYVFFQKLVPHKKCSELFRMGNFPNALLSQHRFEVHPICRVAELALMDDNS